MFLHVIICYWSHFHVPFRPKIWNYRFLIVGREIISLILNNIYRINKKLKGTIFKSVSVTASGCMTVAGMAGVVAARVKLRFYYYFIN